MLLLATCGLMELSPSVCEIQAHMPFSQTIVPLVGHRQFPLSLVSKIRMLSIAAYRRADRSFLALTDLFSFRVLAFYDAQ